MKLRQYQEAAVDSIFHYYQSPKKGNPILVAATGAGKSLIIGNFIQRVSSDARKRLIMCTHVKELIEQNYQKLVAFWPEAPVGIYSAGIGKRQPWKDIVCGGIQSMYKKPHIFGHRDFLLIDECHLLAPQSEGQYMKFIQGLKETNPDLKIIGFTATPWRLKGGSLIYQNNAIFTDICYEITMKELVSWGYLSPLISKSSIIQGDLSKVKKTAGEFNLLQMERAFNVSELTNSALDEIDSLAADRSNFLFFCSGISHCYSVCNIMKNRGWSVEVITSETPRDDRMRILSDFKNKEGRKALINNSVLTTGVDLPNIDCIVLLRATTSSVLYLQILGRGMRLHPGKQNCLILDYAGNIERFGAADLITAPGGSFMSKKPKEVDDTTPTHPPQKICPKCREPVLAALPRCPGCDYQFPEKSVTHDQQASSNAVVSGEMTPTFIPVTSTRYSVGIDKNNNEYLKISYLDKWGIIAHEFVHFAYNPFYKNQWFLKRSALLEAPVTAKDALAKQADFFEIEAVMVKEIRGKSGRKYFNVVDCRLKNSS